MQTLLAKFARHCAANEGATVPKYRRLMEAIETAVATGVVAPGDRLPTEKDIAEAVPYALGTVQRALNGLVADGLLMRNRRLGTFVSDTPRPLSDTSRFSFENIDGSDVGEIQSRVSDICKIHGHGDWVAAMGPCANGYILITRVDRSASGFHNDVEIHLRADRFGELSEMSPADLAGENVRQTLEKRFSVRIDRIDISAAVAIRPAWIIQKHRSAASRTVLAVKTIGFDKANAPVFLQSNYVAGEKFRLNIKDLKNIHSL